MLLEIARSAINNLHERAIFFGTKAFSKMSTLCLCLPDGGRIRPKNGHRNAAAKGKFERQARHPPNAVKTYLVIETDSVSHLTAIMIGPRCAKPVSIEAARPRRNSAGRSSEIFFLSVESEELSDAALRQAHHAHMGTGKAATASFLASAAD